MHITSDMDSEQPQFTLKQLRLKKIDINQVLESSEERMIEDESNEHQQVLGDSQ